MDLAFLHPLYEHPGPWASVYAGTPAPLESVPGERSLTAAAVTRELTEQGADEATCRAVRRAVEELRHDTEPYGRALFARDGRVVLDPTLAAPPPADLAFWAPLPRTAPLLDLAGEDVVCVVAYVDRRGARFELRGALGGEGAAPAAGGWWPVHRTGGAGRSERHFHLWVENTWEHNAAEVADALAVCQEETRADLLVLVGEDRERGAVRDRLPRRLLDRVVQAPPGVGGRLPDEDLARVRAEHVRRRAADEVERFLAARGPDAAGRRGAVEDVAELVEAAREHRIDELLVRAEGPDTHRAVWVGEDPDQLAVHRTELRTLGVGEDRARSARADDALLRSTVSADAPAVSVTPASEATGTGVPAGGLGALLRWT
ncbi:Vms1/Ankzf1 family peptidyl-tRNA hydrolase [Streptomyces heilongjiangensis]|uniref:Vms1/Ankzf1 family peptidyl-tRNA hydrolase n=1 Tax=Streptomyces heilongjiangensis TaxID=945052 RepID=A0ABW1B7L3_9ACTN|nr:Vms1/Ankzf1 family peptidyl-tRNA hydrolase [Streptomyces heilongjiangensis]MDC2947698.1 Vms1/Ankzf1 family peptidyl-tRNA hydrolase [Streptomyces heilongjiangensis]